MWWYYKKMNLLLLFVKINVRLLFKLFKLKINVKLLFELFKLKYFTFYLHLVVVQYNSSLVYFPNISIHCMGVNAFSFQKMSKIKFLRIFYSTILNILYFCTISAVATRNVKKLKYPGLHKLFNCSITILCKLLC